MRASQDAVHVRLTRIWGNVFIGTVIGCGKYNNAGEQGKKGTAASAPNGGRTSWIRVGFGAVSVWDENSRIVDYPPLFYRMRVE